VRRRWPRRRATAAVRPARCGHPNRCARSCRCRRAFPGAASSRRRLAAGTIEGETPGAALTFGVKSDVPATETIKIEAKLETTYYVTFRGEADGNGDRGIVAVETVTVDGPKGTEGTLDISDKSVTPKSDTSAFEGWSETEGGDVITETTITVTESKDLYAKIVKANWIHFDENVDYAVSDSDPTYTGPVYVKETDILLIRFEI